MASKLAPGATFTGTGEALTDQKAIAHAVNRNLEYLKTHSTAALDVAQACVALGSSATAFEILHGYYFGVGAWASAAPMGGDDDRYTSALFQPVMRGIWSEPAFEALVERIGLSSYWRQTQTIPDYRRKT